MDDQNKKKLDRMFFPRGLAVFGGVTKPASFAHSIVMSLVNYGFEGDLYPISPKGGVVPGTDLPVYRSLAQVPGPVDLASVSVPARDAVAVIADCAAYGVSGAQVHTSGFSETGKAEDAALEEEMVKAAAGKVRLVGPNCFGLHSPGGKITLLPSFDFPRQPGPVAFVSQSGGVANDFGHEARLAGLFMSKMASFGNACDLDAAQLLDYLAQDPETGFIAGYLEGVKDGPKFLASLKNAAAKKPVVVWKGGLTPLGSRATQSHTGSLGGEEKIWTGALKQAGAVAVQGLEPMMDALTALVYTRSRGRRIALVGGGGAIGVFSSDLAHRWGLAIPEFSPKTQEILQSYFPTPGNSVKNPLDTGTPALPLDTVQALVSTVLEREPIDVLVLIMLLHPLEVVMPTFMEMMGFPKSPGGEFFRGFAPTLAELREKTGKDVVLVLENRTYRHQDVEVEATHRKLREEFQSHGIAVFSTAERALSAIRLAGECKTPPA